MTKHRSIVITLVLVILLTSSTAILAQSATETPIPPPTFSDGRINDIVGLGGLAIYCVDQNNDTHVNTFQNGRITVWGVGDQKYIELTADQLRGNEEISQAPAVMEAEMTEAAPSAMQSDAMMTEEAPEMMDATLAGTATEPFLLAQATTPSGAIGFFRVGEDTFALQGHDDKGSFYTYTWTGCSTGVLDHTTLPYLPMLEVVPTEEMSEMMTPEATASS